MDTHLAQGQRTESRIFVLRGHRVMPDADLAKLYGVTVKALTLERASRAGSFTGSGISSVAARPIYLAAIAKKAATPSRTSSAIAWALLGTPVVSHSANVSQFQLRASYLRGLRANSSKRARTR